LKALNAEPRFGQALRLRGELLLKLNRAREAFVWLTVYIELSRQDPRAAPPLATVYRDRGLALAAVRRHSEALADLTRALDLDPHSAPILADRGWTYLKSEAVPLAKHDFEAALNEDPQWADANNGLGLTEVLGGDYEKGVGHARKALDSGRENPRLVYNAARVFAQAYPRALRDARLPRTRAEELSETYAVQAVNLIRKAL